MEIDGKKVVKNIKNVKKILISSLSTIGLMVSSLVVASNVTSNYYRQYRENEFSFQLPACCETGLYCDIYVETYFPTTEELLNSLYFKGKPQDDSLNDDTSDDSSDNEVAIESAFKELKDYFKEQSNKLSEEDKKLYKQLAKITLENDDLAIKMSDYQKILEKNSDLVWKLDKYLY